MILEKIEMIERPGYIGKRKAERYAEYDGKYGKGNWKFMWEWGELFLDFVPACHIYTQAYLQDSFQREDLWKDLFGKALNFYDNNPSNVNSGLDFNIQEAASIHIQDIAARWVGLFRGWKFKGNRLIQIRGPESEGHLLMPGIVQFHKPELIVIPNIAPKWAAANSVESFYQNNRWLVVNK